AERAPLPPCARPLAVGEPERVEPLAGLWAARQLGVDRGRLVEAAGGFPGLGGAEQRLGRWLALSRRQERAGQDQVLAYFGGDLVLGAPRWRSRGGGRSCRRGRGGGGGPGGRGGCGGRGYGRLPRGRARLTRLGARRSAPEPRRLDPLPRHLGGRGETLAARDLARLARGRGRRRQRRARGRAIG